jgi:DNA-binding GntR family transcriptional regulator
MNPLVPPNAADVRKLAETRLAAVTEEQGLQETVTIEWRGQQRPVHVITMPVNVLSYNPGTHRVRAQRSLDPVRDRELDSNPFGDAAQAYLHHLLMGDPADPTKVDPAFEALKEDLRLHGQNDPGIITRDGVLINANTRCAALRELGQEHIRVGVLPTDAGIDDIQSIELSLQLRRDHKRDYSFVNFLLAIDERVAAGRPVAEIQQDFRIKAPTFERSRWILTFIREAIERSEVLDASGQPLAMRLVDFETDKGKLEELHRAYTALKAKSPEDAEALREQRLLAVALGKSKTDVRLIEADFAERYMKGVLPTSKAPSSSGLKIPGTGISVAGPSQKVEALRTLTDQVLQARAVELAKGAATPAAVAAADAMLRKVDEALDVALTQAGKQGRVIKKRFAAVDRLSHSAVADARSTSNFNPDDLEDALVQLKANVVKLAQLVTRGNDSKSDGISWLRAVASVPDTAS